MHMLYRAGYLVFVGIGLFFVVLALNVLIQGKDHPFLRKEEGDSDKWIERMKVKWGIFKKCARILLFPVPTTVGLAMFWWLVLYRNDIHLHEKFEGMCVALITVTGVPYALVAAMILQIVWGRLKEMKDAAKLPELFDPPQLSEKATLEEMLRVSRGFEIYARLKHDNLSPVLWTLLFVLSGFMLTGFMAPKYCDASCGLFCISSISYLLSAIYYIIREIDRPLDGTIYVRTVPPIWDGIDARLFRRLRRELEHKRLLKLANRWNPELLLLIEKEEAEKRARQ